jgi:hypothetical protein
MTVLIVNLVGLALIGHRLVLLALQTPGSAGGGRCRG